MNKILQQKAILELENFFLLQTDATGNKLEYQFWIREGNNVLIISQQNTNRLDEIRFSFEKDTEFTESGLTIYLKNLENEKEQIVINTLSSKLLQVRIGDGESYSFLKLQNLILPGGIISGMLVA